MITDIKGRVEQVTPSVLDDGDQEYLRMTKLGQLFTADWHQRLVLAGKVYKMNLGTTSGDSTATGLTGNAAHDNDQPEIVIAIDTGWLIPIEIELSVQVNDDDAYDDVTQIAVFADRSQTVAAGTTGTVNTAVNLLDGGDAFAGRCFDTITADITNPVGSDVLAFKYWEVTQVATETAGGIWQEKYLLKNFSVPILLAGPCSIVGYVTGTNTPVYFGSITFAHLPASWVTLS